jgi:hypothetical protein
MIDELDHLKSWWTSLSIYDKFVAQNKDRLVLESERTILLDISFGLDLSLKTSDGPIRSEASILCARGQKADESSVCCFGSWRYFRSQLAVTQSRVYTRKNLFFRRLVMKKHRKSLTLNLGVCVRLPTRSTKDAKNIDTCHRPKARMDFGLQVFLSSY